MSRPGWDYCPHCCVTHKIGEHPRDGESESEYLARMARLESTEVEAKPTALQPAVSSVLAQLIECAEIRRDQWAAVDSDELDDIMDELHEADAGEAAYQVDRINYLIETARAIENNDKEFLRAVLTDYPEGEA